MTNSIVPSLSSEELITLFRKEAKIGVDGSVTFSRRGVARLVGKDKVQIQRLLQKCSGDKTSKKSLSESLKPLSGIEFKGGDSLSDNVVTAIVSHFAENADIQCCRLVRAFLNVGLRQSVHLAQNWELSQSQSDRVAYRYLLAEPRAWDKQFPDEFYSHLERLTGIYPKGSHRPYYWAQLTNELVYDHLPKEVSDGVRQAKIANASFDKLHQYLSADGLNLLQNHLDALLILFSAAGSIEDVRAMSTRRFQGQYQLKMRLN